MTGIGLRIGLFVFVLMCVFPSHQAWAAGLRVPPGAVLSLGGGRVDLGCGDLTLDAGARLNGNAGGASVGGFINGGTVSADRARLRVAGHWRNSGAFDAGRSQVTFTDGCTDTATVTGSTRFHDLTFSSATGKTFRIQAGTTQTVTGRLTVQGDSGQPLQLVSTVPDQPAVIDVQGTLDPVVAQVLDVIIRPALTTVAARPVPTLGPPALLLLSLGLAWLGRRRLASRVTC